jgi:xanthine dehydrogenase accessory factor
MRRDYSPIYRGAKLVSSIYESYRDALQAEEPVVLATVIEGKNVGSKLLVFGNQNIEGSLGSSELDRVVSRDALGMLEAGTSEVRHYGVDGEARQDDLSVFIETHSRSPQMIIFGAVDFTRALAAQSKLLGFRVTVCDAREVFVTRRRFPMADELVVDWPDRLLERIGGDLGQRDAVCVLTHDAKFDVPALLSSLATSVGYLGAMGSRLTHEKRVDRLRHEGVTEEQLSRIMSPLGLDIGGRTPEETAVSIVAEIIALRTGRNAPRLSETTGHIH